MELLFLLELSLIILVVAILYSSVGHGGASGYLAVLSFTTLSPEQMSTTALLLNLVVAGVAFAAYYRANHFNWRLTWPFLITSIPASFVGGLLHVTNNTYYILLALVLVYAAIRMILPLPHRRHPHRAPKNFLALLTGAILGLVSGIVGVGGGIFLSPLMLMLGWGSPKVISATAAFFILANSAAGLGGRFASGTLLLENLWLLLVAGLIGGLIGGTAGAQKLSNTGIRYMLSLVLIIAAAKMLLKFF